MLGRVTQRSITMSAMTNLQNAQARTAKAQEQVSSGKAYTKGSENAVAATAALRLNDELAVNREQASNVSDARAWNATQETALKDGALKVLQFARDLTVQAASTGSVDTTGREAIARQLEEVKRSLLGSANTNYQGRAVFAGTNNTTVAFDGTTPYASGDNAGTVERTVSPGVKMQVNVSGNEVFGLAGGTTTAFEELDTLIANVRSGDAAAIGQGLSAIDRRINGVTNAIATIGARDNQLDAAEEVNIAREALLTRQLDDVEGVDMAKAIVDFNMQNVAYQAALASTAKVIQPTLLDFLR